MPSPTVAIRLNPSKAGGVELPILNGSSPVPWSPYGYILQERPQFTLHPLFHAGVYYVQDSSAMYVGHIFRKVLPSPGYVGHLRVLDLCAAPGGKTTDLAASLREAFGDNFTLVSNEVMKDRARVLRDNVARWGDPNVVVTSVDPSLFGRLLPGYFDVVVADVPCSGEGMFRKDERAVQEWSPEVVNLCVARQKRILSDVWPALKTDGFLVYSTCTYEDSENDGNLEWAACTLGGEILPPEDEFSSYGVQRTASGNLLKAGSVPGEGQWVGALRRTSPQQSSCTGSGDSALDVLHPFRPGSKKGEWKGNDFIPDPDWALRIDFDRTAYPMTGVDKQTALCFLHKDSIVLPDAPLGYNVITYKGIPLGFVKNLGRRCNNLLPPARRILMDVRI